MKNIFLSKLDRLPLEKFPFEVVERKGLGHPDSICDGLVEKAGVYLTKYYYENFGMPYHFNIDKAVLVGGRANPVFGGGKVLEPILLHIVGRATFEVNYNGEKKRVPVEDIIKDAVFDYINENFRYLDPNEHIDLKFSIRPGSKDLVGLYEKWIKEKEIPAANDTSVGVGFAPFTETEKICLTLENFLNSPETKRKYPAIGEDIKVLCVRKEEKIRATVAMATISSELRDKHEYLSLKENVREILLDKARELTSRDVEIVVNAADVEENDIYYITVTGTSAEAGDDGQVGRGNRANGLITPLRPMSMEAAAGKNPVSHVGKIYQVIAQRAAEKIYSETDTFKEVYVFIASTIGKPISEPQIANVSYILKSEDVSINDVKGDVEGILGDILEKAPRFWMDYMNGNVKVF
ncbi:MAG: methionine adenosyltransferase [Candidatus Njordarchaeia archaeon]